jgi:hypothetical protein
MADTSHIVGRGKGRTTYSRFLELLRGSGRRLGLLTNGHQFRLVYAGLDFESWCEGEGDRWFDDGEGAEELNGLRQLLSPDALKPVKEVTSGLLDAVEESRKRQADLSSVLWENGRQLASMRTAVPVGRLSKVMRPPYSFIGIVEPALEFFAVTRPGNRYVPDHAGTARWVDGDGDRRAFDQRQLAWEFQDALFVDSLNLQTEHC